MAKLTRGSPALWRRLSGTILLAGGGIPLVGGALRAPVDPLRAAAIIGVALIGIIFSACAIIRRDFPLRPVLRGLAGLLGIIAIAALLAVRARTLTVILPTVPQADIVLRGVMLATGRSLAWLAGAVAYTILSLLILPPQAAATPPGGSCGADSVSEDV